ncbi:tRNA-dependent cyclodipeptide synthase [Nocardiopsis potens]|uniref:tRNA-dependent cyclodipeptide synthase n=1 Tax=Nocardiopsis potens TaxID=1246458 RepID=UPI000345ECB6|nr:tRNA-dependent cyclodipeptide synthase [Nocardiopsis potens]
MSRNCTSREAGAEAAAHHGSDTTRTSADRPLGGAAFEVDAATPSCRRIFERGDHLLIGVSAGNSYFSAERVGGLLSWAVPRFERIDVVYVDTHIDTMLEALGYPPASVRKRVKTQLKDLRRRLRRGVEAAPGAAGSVAVRPLSEYVPLPAYAAALESVDRLLGEDEVLRHACEEQVTDFYKDRADGTALVSSESEMFEAGMAYVRAEFPFFLNTPEMAGVGSSVTCYHKMMPIAKALFREESPIPRHPGQGFIVVRPTDPAPQEGR